MNTVQNDPKSGFAGIGKARIYYETAGDGQPFVMIHAGVADSRQWNNEFVHFSSRYRVLRYDMRTYGKSEPAEGEYSNLTDLLALLDHLELHEPLILMGCSMGGGLALDFTLAQPERVKALIMVGSGPSDLSLDVPDPDKLQDAEKAYLSGDLDLAAELETRVWFDGMGRAPEQVNQGMRKLAYEMDRLALEHDAKKLGKRLPDAQVSAVERLGEITIPMLVIVGEHDLPYLHAAADYMHAKIPSVHKEIIPDAAHLTNMDHPRVFQHILDKFLMTQVREP